MQNLSFSNINAPITNLAWQIQQVPIMTAEMWPEHYGKHVVFIIYSNRNDPTEGWDVVIAQVSHAPTHIYAPNELISMKEYADAKEYAEEFVREFEDTDDPHWYRISEDEEEYLKLNTLSWQLQPAYDYSEMRYQMMDLIYKKNREDGLASNEALIEAQNNVDMISDEEILYAYISDFGVPPVVDDTATFDPLNPLASQKLSWQIQPSNPIPMEDAQIGDLVVWKGGRDEYGDVVIVNNGDVGVIVAVDYYTSRIAMHVDFYGKPTLKENMPWSFAPGYLVEKDQADVYKADDFDELITEKYKQASQEQPIFICLWTPDEVKEKLSSIKDLDDDLHVTLVFRPPVAQTPEKNKELLQKIISIAKEYESIKVDFGGTAQFDNPDKSDVALVNIVEGPELYTKIVNAIEEVYGEWEKKFGFTSHMTIHEKGTGEIPEIEKFSWEAKHIGVTFGSTKDYEPENDTRIFNIELGTGTIEETLEKKAWQITPDYDYGEMRFQLIDVVYKEKIEAGWNSEIALREAQNEVDVMHPHDLVEKYSLYYEAPALLDNAPTFDPTDTIQPLSWQVQEEAKRVPGGSAMIGDIIVWKSNRSGSYANGRTIVNKGSVGEIVFIYANESMAVEFKDHLSLKEMNPMTQHKGYIVYPDDVDIYAKEDASEIPLDKYAWQIQEGTGYLYKGGSVNTWYGVLLYVDDKDGRYWANWEATKEQALEVFNEGLIDTRKLYSVEDANGESTWLGGIESPPIQYVGDIPNIVTEWFKDSIEAKLAWQVQPEVKFTVSVSDYDKRAKLGETKEDAVVVCDWRENDLGTPTYAVDIGVFENSAGGGMGFYNTKYTLKRFKTYEEANEYADKYAQLAGIGRLVGISNEEAAANAVSSLKFADPLTYTDKSDVEDGEPFKDRALMFHTEEATDIDLPVDTMWLEPDKNFNAPSNDNALNKLDRNDNTILENERNRKKTLTWLEVPKHEYKIIIATLGVRLESAVETTHQKFKGTAKSLFDVYCTIEGYDPEEVAQIADVDKEALQDDEVFLNNVEFEDFDYDYQSTWTILKDGAQIYPKTQDDDEIEFTEIEIASSKKLSWQIQDDEIKVGDTVQVIAGNELMDFIGSSSTLDRGVPGKVEKIEREFEFFVSDPTHDYRGTVSVVFKNFPRSMEYLFPLSHWRDFLEIDSSERLSWQVHQDVDVDYWLEYEEGKDWFTDPHQAAIEAEVYWNAMSDFPVMKDDFPLLEDFAKRFIDSYGRVERGILLAYIMQETRGDSIEAKLAWQVQPEAKVYKGVYSYTPLNIGISENSSYNVLANEEILRPAPSLQLWNHSPSGFAWGYMGSGPAQLALAILLDYTNDNDFAIKYHQQFKTDFIADLPRDDAWTITSSDIETWIQTNIINKQSWQLQIDPKDPNSWREVIGIIKDELGEDYNVRVFISNDPKVSYIIAEIPQELKDAPEIVKNVKANEILLILKRFDNTITRGKDLFSKNFVFEVGK